jgi:hypothetical protein
MKRLSRSLQRLPHSPNTTLCPNFLSIVCNVPVKNTCESVSKGFSRLIFYQRITMCKNIHSTLKGLYRLEKIHLSTLE